MSDPVKCPNCERSFDDDVALMSHQMAAHNGTPEEWARGVVATRHRQERMASADPEVRREAREEQIVEHLAKIRAGVNFVVAVLLLAVVAGVAIALVSLLDPNSADPYGG